MVKQALKFSLTLTFTLVVTLGVHYSFLTKNNLLTPNLLFFQAYGINWILAIFIFLVINFLKERKSNYLGFIFMGSSGIKFAFFFIMFYPVYKADLDLDKLEFTSFFIPYAIALILETTSLIKILNKS